MRALRWLDERVPRCPEWLAWLACLFIVARGVYWLWGLF